MNGLRNTLCSFLLIGFVLLLAQDLIHSYISNKDTVTVELNEEEQNEQSFEKEIQLFYSNIQPYFLKNSGSLLEHNFTHLISFYKNPFLKEDIKPPIQA